MKGTTDERIKSLEKKVENLDQDFKDWGKESKKHKDVAILESIRKLMTALKDQRSDYDAHWREFLGIDSIHAYSKRKERSRG